MTNVLKLKEKLVQNKPSTKYWVVYKIYQIFNKMNTINMTNLNSKTINIKNSILFPWIKYLI